MRGKTHITMGIAAASVASLATPLPMSPLIGVLAVTGGAFGGVVPDFDTKSTDYIKDALVARIIAGVIIALAIGLDYVFKFGMCKSIIANGKMHNIVTLVILGVICILCIISKHREFSHSFLALILLSIVIGVIYKPLMLFFAAGFCSHLLLDLLNKKPLKLFYPLKFGMCFHLCYADEVANKVFLYIGLAISFIMFVVQIVLTIQS